MQTSQIQASNESENKYQNMYNNIYHNFLHPWSNLFKILALFSAYNVVALNYVGITYGITTLIKINPYTSYIASSIFEFIGIMLCHFNDIIGRKKSLMCQIFTMSLSLILIGFLPNDEPGKIVEYNWAIITKISLFLISKLMVSAAFNTIIIYTAELYDIKVRNTAITLNGSLGFLLSLISPQINLLETLVWQPLPYIIYSTSGIISCIIIVFLPETYSANND